MTGRGSMVLLVLLSISFGLFAWSTNRQINSLRRGQEQLLESQRSLQEAAQSRAKPSPRNSAVRAGSSPVSLPGEAFGYDELPAGYSEKLAMPGMAFQKMVTGEIASIRLIGVEGSVVPIDAETRASSLLALATFVEKRQFMSQRASRIARREGRAVRQQRRVAQDEFPSDPCLLTVQGWVTIPGARFQSEILGHANFASLSDEQDKHIGDLRMLGIRGVLTDLLPPPWENQ